MGIHRNLITVKKKIKSSRKEERNPVLALKPETDNHFASVSLSTSAKLIMFKV